MALLAVDLTGPTASSLRWPLESASAMGRTAGSMMVRAWWNRTVPARGVSELILLRCPLVLVDQSTQDVATTQLRKGRRTRWVTTHRRYGRAQAEAAVRAVLVVVLNIGAQDMNKVRAADDQ
jgi:hypothetical protein